MKRIFESLTVLVWLLAICGAALSATLRDQAIVDSPVVRLGDVLYGAEAAQDTIVSTAPPPGERMTLSAFEVRSAAEKAGLSGAGDIAGGFVEIRRAGTPVPEDLIRERLREALAAHGKDGPLSLRLTGLRDAPQIASGLDPAAMDIAIRDYVPRSGRLTADLILPTVDGSERRLEIRAIVTGLQHIPVLISDMPRGAVIRNDDITWATIDARRINRTMITEAEDLVGRAPRRRLQGGKPLRLSDVQRPVLVERGAAVTMIVVQGPLRLTALGKAMEDGSRSDIIRLTNTTSGRIVEARVTGPGRVEVLSAGGITLSQR